MSRPTIENIKKLPDFATVYHWEISVIKKPNIKNFPTDDDINFRAISSTVPKATNQAIEINIRGFSIKQHGITQFDKQWTITLAETVDSKITKWIMAWKDACWDPVTGKQNLRKDLQAVFEIHRLDRKNKVIFKQQLIGCWLEDYDPIGGELSAADSEIVKPQLTISYDYFKTI